MTETTNELLQHFYENDCFPQEVERAMDRALSDWAYNNLESACQIWQKTLNYCDTCEDFTAHTEYPDYWGNIEPSCDECTSKREPDYDCLDADNQYAIDQAIARGLKI